jgi:hypothetical protein
MAFSEEINEQMLREAYSVTPNYDIDYNDPRFGKIDEAKKGAMDDLNLTYSDMIANTDTYYQKQIDALDKWEDKQTQIQNEQTDFAIEQIEQQKNQAHKDYLKEQSGAYVDWQKQSNKYGANAEQMAAAGLTNTGFSESSQVGMYNTYQNRVATAREAYGRAVLNYDNAMKEARLQNSAALAEIAFQTLRQQLELSLQGFQYKNQLIQEQANKKIELDNMYWNRYQDVLQQINTENAMKEDIRQYNETMKWNTEQAELGREHDKTMAKIENDYQVARDEENRKFQAAQAELDRKHDLALVEANTKAAKEKADHEHELAMAKLKKEHENSLELIEKERKEAETLAKYKYDLEHPTNGYGVVKPTTKNTTSYKVTTGGNKPSQIAYTNRLNTEPSAATFKGSTYKEAVTFLKSQGVSSAKASAAMTESEWSRRRNSYSMTGQGSYEVKQYKSYKEYITDYVQYCLGK